MIKWNSECEFVSAEQFGIIPIAMRVFTFGTGGQNGMKETAKFYSEKILL